MDLLYKEIRRTKGKSRLKNRSDTRKFESGAKTLNQRNSMPKLTMTASPTLFGKAEGSHSSGIGFKTVVSMLMKQKEKKKNKIEK